MLFVLLLAACDASDDELTSALTAEDSQAAALASPLDGGAATAPDAQASEAGMRAPVRVGPLRIVALGDSITETSCTSQLLFKQLRDSGRTGFDLVGTRQNQQGCGVANPDRDCEGHSGYLVTDLIDGKAHAAELPVWSRTNRADVALMHFGTNDVWSSIPPSNILRAYAAVVASLREAQPRVAIFVAQIIPLAPSGCPDCGARVQALNRQIPAWAAELSTPSSPIYVVDQWTGFESRSDTYDNVHPNLAGSQKMADRWASALRAAKLL